ncbi:hypothetical protein EOA75_02805 [Mesorhizobium sp. M1A.F.Ca.IN.022.07.1.1]|uniref:hypothetical protein n=1 Tax=unclassified Mesorhizobium TaxID=325217 RepID=UPI000FCBFB4A|nr:MULTISPECIES: hypothetical protein [unclassified Mesorhizobium]RUV97721.1 hypothetical protein EOA75_02805 [Mesorhizobium sp. M1A.F.Ca.IN.022.07.1.1]RWG06770.1 MAG: hypothetical protein EOQ54_06760 [Mesorhizobium sp.]RWH01603.1 MAG: hypothetical protein EOQ72_07155 [Mesorhizobium sp.]TIN48295.1 MAG: hypothetical protein E5Y25_03185 [Mesorhizobium sp.]TIR90431.1 MAG: hypothetical protein E5X08_23345 [Mesorhizobium sp.]
MLAVAICGLLSFALSGLMRWGRVDRRWYDLLIPLGFFLSYWLTYNRLPSFPPVGAVNKVFYLAAVGSILGVATEWTGSYRLGQLLLAAMPVASAAYIGDTIALAQPLDLVVAALVGAAALYALHREADYPDEGSGLRPAIMLAVASAGFAPIAFMGASSSSLQLSLGVAFGIAGIVVGHLSRPNYRFGWASLLGGAAGMMAVAQTVALITRKIDLLALAVLLLLFLVSSACRVILDRLDQKTHALATFVFAGFCLVPAVAAVAVMLARKGFSLPL